MRVAVEFFPCVLSLLSGELGGLIGDVVVCSVEPVAGFILIAEQWYDEQEIWKADAVSGLLVWERWRERSVGCQHS